MTAQEARGLDGVIAASSAICSITEGSLRYRGYEIEDLAAHCSFEEVVYLLWHGDLPQSVRTLDSFRAELTAGSELPRAVARFVQGIGPTGAGANPMSFLRTAVSTMSLFDPEEEHMSPAANLRKATRLVARMPTLVGGIANRLQNRDLGAADSRSGLAANFLQILHCQEPKADMVKALDSAFVLHADHELNASTFAARVTAATLSDIYSAVTSALGALKGSLHGGASQSVLAMLEEIGSLADVEPWLERTLGAGQRVPGFGHRVYRLGDPRASILKDGCRTLSRSAADVQRLRVAERLEDLMRQRTGLLANVDFYSAPFYRLLGIPSEMFTAVFAMARMAGWTAHIMEQYEDNRLIRPRAAYRGAGPRNWRPIDVRAMA